LLAAARMNIIASVELSGGGRARSNRGDAMAEDKIPPDIAKMSFEDALAELQKLVKSLEKGDSKLDDAITSYKRGVDLKRHCEAKLQEAQLKVEKIVLSAEGTIGKESAKLD
jgi:exodeoxyribonuclease VII small subunit